MSRKKKTANADWSLTMENLKTALYKRDDNPYAEYGSVFNLALQMDPDEVKALLDQIRPDGASPFMSDFDYAKVKKLYSKGQAPGTFSVTQPLFLIAHTGGWRSGTRLSNSITVIFNDRSDRPVGGWRSQFCDDILYWKYEKTEKGKHEFFYIKNEGEEQTREGSDGISEYIVERNYDLIYRFCKSEKNLREILGGFAGNMLDSEKNRKNIPKSRNLFDDHQEEISLLCKCLDTLLQAYDNTEDISEKRWYLARGLAWLVIGAMLRGTMSCQLIKNHLEEHLPPEDTTGDGEEHVREKEEAANTDSTKKGQDGANTGLSTLELFWSAGKNWYEEARKPGARFYSLDIIDHILPSAKDTLPETEFEHGFPFRAADTDDHTIQCSRFSKLLMDKDSIYHQGHYILIGEGGIGKTTTLMSAMVDAYKEKGSYSGESVIPLFIELSLAPDSQDSHAYDGTSSSVVHRLIYSMLQQKSRRNDRSDILRECMNDESSIAKDTVHELISSVNDEGIKIALLIDGLNEVSGESFTGHRSSSAQGRVLQEIIGLADEYHNVTIILTSRNRILVDNPSFHSFYLRGLEWEDIEKYLQGKEKTEKVISSVRNGDKGLLEILSIPMFLTMYARLQDTEGITTRGELMKIFFHERLESRKEEYGIYRQGDIAERIDRDGEQSVRGRMERGTVPLSMQWLFLDVLIPEIAAKMEEAEAHQITGKEKDEIQAFRISRKGVRSILEFLFKDQDSLYCGRYKEFSNSCFEEQLQGKDLEDVISKFTTDLYNQRAAEYTDAFLTYCESSIGILYKEGEKSYGFIHQHFRDYFAAVSMINKMKTAYTAFQECDAGPARGILQAFGEKPLNPILMIYIGEYLGEHHNNPVFVENEKSSTIAIIPKHKRSERLLITGLLDVYRGIDQEDGYGVYNLIEILKRVRKDLSGSDFHSLDLRKCHFNKVPMDTQPGVVLSGALISAGNWFAEGHSSQVNFASWSPDGRRIVTASHDSTARIWDTDTGGLLHTLEGHYNVVLSTNWSPNGMCIVTASSDKTAKVWDADTGGLLHTLEGHSASVNSANWSPPDGRRIVTASSDKTAKVWDADTGGLFRTLEGHTRLVNSASWSPDGRRIVTASDDRTARVWDANTGRLLHTLEGHIGSVYSASWSPDGRRIVTASADKTAKIWDADTGELLHTLEGHSSRVNAASWSSDGRHIVTASGDRTARVWSAVSGKILHTLEGHSNRVNSASWSSEGRCIITASHDRTARVWDADTGELLHKLEGHSNRVNAASWSPDGRRIVTASADCTARVWDAATGGLLHTLEGLFNQVNAASWSPDVRRIVTASNDEIVKVWDPVTGGLLLTLEGHSRVVNAASWSPDGRRIVTASRDRTARVWDAATGRLLHTLEGHFRVVNAASWSPDGRRIVTASSDKTAKIWDADTGGLFHTLEGHSGWVFSASWSPDGRRIITASADKVARVWDAATGRLLHTLEGHSGKVWSASWSPGKRRIVTASRDCTARVWDAATGGLFHTLEGHTRSVNAASWSPDGRHIVTASRDRTARVWDAATGGLFHTLEGHSGRVFSASWSPDGRRIVTASSDRTARVWDISTGELLHTLEGHSGWVFSVSWSPDGRRIVTASHDSTARIWDAASGRLSKTLYEVPGLHVKGVDFRKVNSASKITETQKEIFRQYGALV